MRVVVGISGGIAAAKATGVVRQFVLQGHDVHVVPTEAALRFVGVPTLEALSRNPVTAGVFDDVAQVRHVALGQSADLIVIAPATANTLAKMAAGLADDLLGTTLLATTAPVVVAPAMHTEMWQHPATAQNVRTLAERGVRFVGPVSGQLTGNDSGVGRMAEPDDIVAAALAVLQPQDLTGVRVVVSAGGTHEPIDPVRFIANRSSGAQGVALARAAQERGAHVTLVGANLLVDVPPGVEFVAVERATKLHEAMMSRADADVVIMAAAVSDYAPIAPATSKLKKDDLGDTLTLELVKNPDILAELSARADRGLVVGFAAETASDEDELLRLGREKIARKGCDLLAVNEVGVGKGFGAVDNSVRIIDASGEVLGASHGSKLSVAHGILDAVVARRTRETNEEQA